MSHWMWLLIGWLVGSFFGVQAILAMFKGKAAG